MRCRTPTAEIQPADVTAAYGTTLANILNPALGRLLSASGRWGTPSPGKALTKLSRKILVVEDHADTRELLARLLELENFRVVTAPDGAAGLETVEFEDPDLVVTDISMPNLDGIELIRALRSNTKFEGLPIVTMTAYGQGIASEALTAGADSAFTKPLEFEQLINSIKRLICPELSLASSEN